MIHKIIGGRGKQRNIKSSISYLLRETKQDEQKFVEVLSTTNKEDLLIFNKTISSSKKHPYVCGVLSFAEADIDQQVKIDLMDDWEDLLFAGIDENNRPPVMWVQHTDKGRLELNYLTFNQLQDGRAYTTYLAKRDNKIIKSLIQRYDLEHGFKSPDEQDNKLLVAGINKKLPADKQEFIKHVNDLLISQIVVENINNSNELETFIQKDLNLKINRRGDKYISVIRPDSDDRPIRLKGEIYEKNRDYTTYRTASKSTARLDTATTRRTITELRNNYKREYETKQKENNNRYKPTIQTTKHRNNEELEEANNIQASNKLSNTITNNIFNNKFNNLINEWLDDVARDEVEQQGAKYGNDEKNNREEATTTKQHIIDELPDIKKRLDDIRRKQLDINKSAQRIREQQQRTEQRFNRIRKILCKCVEAIKYKFKQQHRRTRTRAYTI